MRGRGCMSSIGSELLGQWTRGKGKGKVLWRKLAKHRPKTTESFFQLGEHLLALAAVDATFASQGRANWGCSLSIVLSDRSFRIHSSQIIKLDVEKS